MSAGKLFVHRVHFYLNTTDWCPKKPPDAGQTPQPRHAQSRRPAAVRRSKGAASQGLKVLRSFGAVRTLYVAADRRDHYVADFELSKFASAFIKEEVQPHLDSGAARIERMQAHLARLPAREREAASQRLAKLRHWKEKGEGMLPWLLKFLVA